MKRFILALVLTLAWLPAARGELFTSILLSAAINGMASAGSAEEIEGGPANPKYRAQAHTELAAAYFTRGQLGVAVQELNEAVKADSSYAPAYNLLGLVYMELHENETARGHFDRALRLAPRDSDILNNFGWFLCQTGQPQESLRYFQEAVKNPLYATPEKAYFNIGLCSLKAGDEAGAEEYFRKALLLAPEMPPPLFYLAGILYRKGNVREAKGLIDRFMTRVPEPTAEQLWLALRIERQSGDKTLEASYAYQLRKHYPGSPEARALNEGRYE